MRLAYPICIVFAATLAGCAPGTEQPKGPNNNAASDAAEKSVRAVIADHLKVDSSAIPMDRPISEPPLKADDLDLVEMVMELEERLGIEISDAAVERHAGGKFPNGTVRITPNQLVMIVREAPRLEQLKRRK